jgi:tetratricopeptide (TPR) repeat protein
VLLGKARQLHFDGSPQAFMTIGQSLEANPNLVEAKIFLAELLLGVEAHAAAAEDAEEALEVNGTSIPALSILAGARFLAHNEQGFQEAVDRVRELNPRDGTFYLKLAEVCVQNRLYREAVEFARQAIVQDERLWNAYGVLGVNLMRIGDIEEGRANLEIAFEGDPYNIWIKNTLDLLDTFSRYDSVRSERFEAFVYAEESALLAPLVLDLAEEAYDTLSAKYAFEPQTPIRIELYPNSADFSVRTVGLAGVGALGVCFGGVVALDSPSAREIGEFNWGSTLWHEMAHVVSLGMTDHRVPRWLSEGISVFEERHAFPAWGEELSIPFLQAYQHDRLLGIERINNGFIRPTYPGQVQVSYFQASVICDWVTESRGFGALLEMLSGYRQGMGTREVIESVLDLDMKEFDEGLAAYIDIRFGDTLSALRTEEEEERGPGTSTETAIERADRDRGDFMAQLAAGRLLFRQNAYEQAEDYLGRARELIPEYGSSEGPDAYLAQIYHARGDTVQAIEALSRLVSLNEIDYGAHLALAALLEACGDLPHAAEVLDRAIFIYPLESLLHERRAIVATGTGQHERAVASRRAVLSLDPVDRAEALYRLAVALADAGERQEARRVVLRALEIAPNVEAALDLLLRVQPPPEAEKAGEPC